MQAMQTTPWKPFGLKWLELKDVHASAVFYGGQLQNVLVGGDAHLVCDDFSMVLSGLVRIYRNSTTGEDGGYRTVLNTAALPSLNMFGSFGICLLHGFDTPATSFLAETLGLLMAPWYAYLCRQLCG